jgi:GntR family transcriptional regulator
LRRLRLANEVPLAVEDSHILLSRFPGLERIDFSGRSLYQTIRDRYSIKFGWADEIVEALPATKEEAELLNVPRRSSLLCITRTLMAADETPLEFAISHYRGDRYRASLRVSMVDAD